VVISDDAEALGMARVPLALPAGVPEWLSPIIAILPPSSWPCTWPTRATTIPDRPRALKKVTETR
jgi:glucosamine--fructose-6-phosphate aminotransferase (isomerizing)